MQQGKGSHLQQNSSALWKQFRDRLERRKGKFLFSVRMNTYISVNIRA